MFHFSNLVRSKGDPKIISTGPSSLTAADRLARGLGWDARVWCAPMVRANCSPA